eukprot:91439_1
MMQMSDNILGFSLFVNPNWFNLSYNVLSTAKIEHLPYSECINTAESTKSQFLINYPCSETNNNTNNNKLENICIQPQGTECSIKDEYATFCCGYLEAKYLEANTETYSSQYTQQNVLNNLQILNNLFVVALVILLVIIIWMIVSVIILNKMDDSSPESQPNSEGQSQLANSSISANIKEIMQKGLKSVPYYVTLLTYLLRFGIFIGFILSIISISMIYQKGLHELFDTLYENQCYKVGALVDIFNLQTQFNHFTNLLW